MAVDAAPPSQPLVASCRSRGGAVALTLAGPPPTCRYCGSSEPLDAELSALVARMRARLEQRGAKQRSLTGKLVSAVTGLQAEQQLGTAQLRHPGTSLAEGVQVEELRVLDEGGGRRIWPAKDGFMPLISFIASITPTLAANAETAPNTGNSLFHAGGFSG